MFNPARPVIFDYSDFHLRLPVRPADDAFMQNAGLALPTARFF